LAGNALLELLPDPLVGVLAMVFKLLQSAQKRWKRIQGFRKLELVTNNVPFQDGEQVTNQSDRKAA